MTEVTHAITREQVALLLDRREKAQIATDRYHDVVAAVLAGCGYAQAELVNINTDTLCIKVRIPEILNSET